MLFCYFVAALSFFPLMAIACRAGVFGRVVDVEITSWLVSVYDFCSLVVKNCKLTYLFVILYNKWMKIVQAKQPWSFLLIFLLIL